jgi:hypothetical protein
MAESIFTTIVTYMPTWAFVQPWIPAYSQESPIIIHLTTPTTASSVPVLIPTGAILNSTVTLYFDTVPPIGPASVSSATSSSVTGEGTKSYGSYVFQPFVRRRSFKYAIVFWHTHQRMANCTCKWIHADVSFCCGNTYDLSGIQGAPRALWPSDSWSCNWLHRRRCRHRYSYSLYLCLQEKKCKDFAIGKINQKHVDS